MPRLKRLTIHNFPRVKPGTELLFNDGTNVLLGINGSGKTTLLKLLSKVCSGVFEGLERVDFHVSYEFEHDQVTYTAELQYEASEQSPASWAEDVLTAPPASPRAAKSRATLVIRKPGEEPIEFELADRGAHVRQGPRSSALSSAPSFFEHAFISASILAIFNSGQVPVAEFDRLFGVDVVPVARLDESTQWLEDSLRRGEFAIRETKAGPRASAGTRTPDSVRKAALAQFSAGSQGALTFGHDRLEFLAQTVDALGYVGATMQLDVVRVTPAAADRLEPGVHGYGRYEFRFVKRDGSRLTPEDLSFGQKRLFAFLYYAAMYPHIVIADELTNGMHDAMIERCLEVVRGRQALLATQNPLLLDNLEFASAEEVRRTFILCSSTEVGGEEQMVWRNMSAEEAENFYRDYKVGISHVNDILRSWGLW